MTISSTIVENQYTGNGSTATYSYTFYTFAQTDLAVSVVSNVSPYTTYNLTLTTDYTVTGAGSISGGSITLVNSGQAWLTGGNLTSGWGITIKRVRPLTQTTDIRNQSTFYAENHEDAFDHMVMLSQQLNEILNRCIKFPVTDATSLTSQLVASSARANSLVGFDASGNVVVTPTGGPFAGFTQGSVLFAGPGGTLTQNNASLFWDNTNTALQINSGNGQVTIRERFSGDIVPNNSIGSGWVRINGLNGWTFNHTFFTFGAMTYFDTNNAAAGSEWEVWGKDSANSKFPIMTFIVATANNHEVHVARNRLDTDAVICNYDTTGPVVYTETGASSILDFGVLRNRLVRINGGTASTQLIQFTGTAANQELGLQFLDNGFAGTLKGRLRYAGTGSAGNRWFGLTNDGADYVIIASTTLKFFESTLNTEYGRWDSTGNFGIATTSPRKPLDVLSTAGAQARFTYTDNSVYTEFLTNSSGNFSITPTGTTITMGVACIGQNGTTSAPGFAFTGQSNTGVIYDGSFGGLGFVFSGNTRCYVSSGGIYIGTGAINWASAVNGGPDLTLTRDAANILAQKNGNNAQTFRTYAGNGANLGIVTVNESLTIAASATTDSSTTIPAGAVILAVAVRVTTVIPTAATFTVTAATGGNTFDTAAVSTAANSTDAGTAAGALYTNAGTKIRITPNLTPGAATGVVRLAIMYYLSTPPTS